jgi:hypothetical protein
VHESRTIHLLAEILFGYFKKGYQFDLKSLKFALEQFIKFHCDMDNEFEITWALWTMKSFKLILEPEIAKMLSQMSNSMIALICLDMRKSKLIPNGLDVNLWKSLLNKDSLYSEHWLLAYEAKVRRWLVTSDDYIEADPFFKILKGKRVRFYHENNILDTTKVKVALESPSLAQYESDKEHDVGLKFTLPDWPKKNNLEKVELLELKVVEEDLPF